MHCDSSHPPLVQKTLNVVTSALEAAASSSTKKVARWDLSNICVNVHVQCRKSVTVWMAGAGITSQSRLDFSEPTVMKPGHPPRNSNCSNAIKTGPTWFAHIEKEFELKRLSALIRRLNHSEGSVFVKELDDEILDANNEDGELDLDGSDRKVTTQTLDLTVETLVSRIDRGGLILQPEFQRDYVWPSSKASTLIESVLMRIPLPVAYLAETPDGDWEVVDGQQRLTSVYSFVRGQFPDGSQFRLGQLKVRSDLCGKTFKELSRADQNAILNYSLRAVVLQNDSHPDLKFELFERLNCGSVQLKDAELRNCMYRGPYNDMLEQLTLNPLLLKIRRADAPHKRMTDRQLILRFFAMKRNSHLNYRGPMKQFMNREMVAHRFAQPMEILELKRCFDDAIESTWAVFGENAFRRWSSGDDVSRDGYWEPTLNVALWDTVLYTFAYFEKRQIIPVADAIREEFLDLMSNDRVFVDYIGRTTDKPDRVRYRADSWRKRVDAIVAVPPNEPRAFSRRLKFDLHTANPTCAICDQHIHAPEDAEVDHILHYWRGGGTVPVNARLAHRFCNLSRGGRD